LICKSQAKLHKHLPDCGAKNKRYLVSHLFILYNFTHKSIYHKGIFIMKYALLCIAFSYAHFAVCSDDEQGFGPHENSYQKMHRALTNRGGLSQERAASNVEEAATIRAILSAQKANTQLTAEQQAVANKFEEKRVSFNKNLVPPTCQELFLLRTLVRVSNYSLTPEESKRLRELGSEQAKAMKQAGYYLGRDYVIASPDEK
jgi:hypothetical protein